MKKTIFFGIIALFFILLSLTGCKKEASTLNNSSYLKPVLGKIYQVELNEDKDIVIAKDKITNTLSYYSYEYRGVTISLLAVKDESGQIHIVLNTCQSCNGSPYAYFVQEENTIQCQNCHNIFQISKLGSLVKDGCNPLGIKNIKEEDDKFIIDHKELEQHKDKFKNWEGPKI